MRNPGIITKIMYEGNCIKVNISLDAVVEINNEKNNVWLDKNNEPHLLKQNSYISFSLPNLNCMDLLGKKVDFEINDDFNKEKVNKKGKKFRDRKIVGVTILNKI